jgi:hypothetical protein
VLAHRLRSPFGIALIGVIIAQFGTIRKGVLEKSCVAHSTFKTKSQEPHRHLTFYLSKIMPSAAMTSDFFEQTDNFFYFRKAFPVIQ